MGILELMIFVFGYNEINFLMVLLCIDIRIPVNAIPTLVDRPFVINFWPISKDSLVI